MELVKQGEQDVKHGSHTGKTGKQVSGRTMKNFLKLAHDSQHGKSSFNDHAFVPGAFLTEFEMVRHAISITEAQVSQDNGLTVEGRGEAVEVLVSLVQGQEIPFNNPSIGVQHN